MYNALIMHSTVHKILLIKISFTKETILSITIRSLNLSSWWPQIPHGAWVRQRLTLTPMDLSTDHSLHQWAHSARACSHRRDNLIILRRTEYTAIIFTEETISSSDMHSLAGQISASMRITWCMRTFTKSSQKRQSAVFATKDVEEFRDWLAHRQVELAELAKRLRSLRSNP